VTVCVSAGALIGDSLLRLHGYGKRPGELPGV